MSTSDSLRNPRPATGLHDANSPLSRKSILPPRLMPWLPALLWAAVIFTLSTDSFSAANTGSILEPILRWLVPAISQARIDAIHFMIRKSAHFTEYFIFFLLLYLGVRVGRPGVCHWSWAFNAWFIAAAYSCLDEVHQSFVACPV